MAFKKSQIQTTDAIASYKTKQETTQNKTVVKNPIDLSDQYDSVVAVFIGDWHIGSIDFDIDSAIDVLEYALRTPNAIIFCLGDMLNSAILDSVSDMYEDIAYPQEQWQVFVDLFKQVADQNKLAVIHTGNHERRIQKKAGIDPVAQAAAAMHVEEKHAPFHAETTVTIKCPHSPDGKFTIPIVTHHGDGGNPEAFSDINKDSLINAMGHTHNFQVWTKTLLTYDHVTHKNVKKEELEIVVAANGGGLYGHAKGYKKIHKAAYLAIDLTATQNPRYEFFKNNDYTEQPVVLATRSFNILSKANTADKEAIIKAATKQIERSKRATQIKVLAKVKEIVEILKEHGLQATEDVERELTKQIIARSKKVDPIKQQALAPLHENDNEDISTQ